jgi:hypothetical protein
VTIADRRLRRFFRLRGYPDPATITQERKIWPAGARVRTSRICSASSTGKVAVSSPEISAIVTDVYTQHLELPAQWSPARRQEFIDAEPGFHRNQPQRTTAAIQSISDLGLFIPAHLRPTSRRRRRGAGCPDGSHGTRENQHHDGPERIPQKRRRQAAELVGNLVIDSDHLTIRPMTVAHSLADERSTVAVPFGKCSNPQNVAAEGHGCPIRHRCFGCASFSSDPSYLPEMRRRLVDLKAIRARVDAFDGAADWAKRDARPSDEEIDALQRHIHAEEDKLAHATSEQRALIESASVTLRKARAVAQVDITLRRRENGEDALLTHIKDRRHIIDAVGQITND